VSAAEAALLGLSDVAGGVQTCLIGPDGLNYFFALGPLSPFGAG
jgi:hypothetical protein